MDSKTCKECSNYRGIDDRTGKIKCAILGVVHIRKMNNCDFKDAKICEKCGKVIRNPIFWKGKIYCLDCFNSLYL